MYIQPKPTVDKIEVLLIIKLFQLNCYYFHWASGKSFKYLLWCVCVCGAYICVWGGMVCMCVGACGVYGVYVGCVCVCVCIQRTEVFTIE